ncbi:nucleotidyltransferase family protein [Rhizobium sp. RM]|uniref:nucleotidyltransferase family protein n=1 Tax=Rhizobium sp. RM TaxID=2748079 RepID=UPI00110E3742|nr:nucleotidyltransferase family protein [Rhizobium sp. RM]NWJ27566.1 nucleotidyltransferase family protein [Rhizobium sp. RM]TMV19977.1 nucleotidyltransferase family protein [Rhizobium sp. Td3]
MDPDVAIVLLAAGKSSRMGSTRHKLLEKIDGIPVVRWSASNALACRARNVVVVTGCRHHEIEEALRELDVSVVHNHAFSEGMASSIVAGVDQAMRAEPNGIMIMLADMPAMTSCHLDRLIGCFAGHGCQAIIRATSQGVPKNPVIFPRRDFGSLLKLRGDNGAKLFLAESRLPVFDVELGDIALLDIDTPVEFDAMRDLLTGASPP